MATLLLLQFSPEAPADRLFFDAVSAASNVGLAHEPLTLGRGGSYVLAASMLAGRFAPLMVLWWMADTTKGAEMAVG